MIEIRPKHGPQKSSPARVYAALALAAAALLVGTLAVLWLGDRAAARRALLAAAGEIELELVQARIHHDELPSSVPSPVTNWGEKQHLARAEWQAQQVHRATVAPNDSLLFLDVEPLRASILELRQKLDSFSRLTQRLWEENRPVGEAAANSVEYDEAYRDVMARANTITAQVTKVVADEKRELNLLRFGLLLGILLVGGGVSATFRRYVSQRHRAEDALRESEEKFRSIYEASGDAIMLLDEKNFFDCNQATLRVFQVATKAEFCRKHPADVSPRLQPGGLESLGLANQRIETALTEGSNHFEWIHMRADGTEFPAEVLLTAVRLSGRRVLQAVVRDVTDRKESEQRLRANEEKLRTISEAALDAVIMMDPDGRAVHWNPAARRMFGYAAEEVIGKDIHQLLTPKRFTDQADNSLAAFFKSGQGRTVGRILELEAIRKGGAEFPIEISVAPIRTGDKWSAVAVVRDITERRQAEESLRAEQQAMRRLLKSHDQERKLIAYEIHDGLAQQLVAAIMQCQAALHMAQDRSNSVEETVGQVLQMLKRSLDETRRLISGVRPPILDEFGVVTAVQGLIDEMESHGGPRIDCKNNIEFQRLEPVLENTIYRIVQESLGNACRHSQTDRVLLELTHEEGLVRIRVQDWGIGFEPGKSSKKRYGLAGIRERARLLGGRVDIQSQLGAGTTVLVELPEDIGEFIDADD